MAAPGRKVLLACGVIGPPAFIAVFLLEGAARAGYDPQRHPVSSLAIGERGWVQRANFLLAGTAIAMFSRGVRPMSPDRTQGSEWDARLLGLAGLGLVGAGLFSTDPVFGYPADAPLRLEQYTAPGHLHNIFSLLFFVGVPGACLVEARRHAGAGGRAWSAYSLLSAAVMLATFVLAGVGFNQDPRLVRRAGVLQRLSVASGLVWVMLRALRLWRATQEDATAD
jgi:hypothetical membrane protein